MTTRLATVLAASLALAAPLGAQQAPQQPPPAGTPHDFRLPEGRTFTLPNGMGVTLVPYGTIPKTFIGLYVRSGNLNEVNGETWLADLTGDLMKEGTTSRTAQQVAAEAAAMGGAVNVGVGLDETTLSGEVLEESAADFVRLLADVVRNPRLPPSELPRLKADRLRDLSVALQDPGQTTNARFAAMLYGDHPYGRIFPTVEQLNGYTPEQARAFWAANFGAQRSHLYVVGRFDARRVEAAVREAFASWARGPAPLINVPQPRSGRDLALLNRTGAPQSTLYIGLPVPDPSSPDWVPLQITNLLLGGSFASRITANIREDKGYTYSPFSFLNVHYRDDAWIQTADVTTNVTGPSLHEIFAEIDRLRAEAPSAEELRGIQNYRAGVFVLQNSTRQGIANLLDFTRLHGLGREYLVNYVQRLNAVTPADVQRIARTYLDPARMLIVVTGDSAQVGQQVEPYRRVTP
jgi:zinc protease